MLRMDLTDHQGLSLVLLVMAEGCDGGGGGSDALSSLRTLQAEAESRLARC